MSEGTAKYTVVLERATATVNLNCQINLQRIAQRWYNVEYRDNVVVVQLRSPDVTAHISGCGEMSCFSAADEQQAHFGMRRIARMIQKEGHNVALRQLRIEVLARCTMPFQIRVGAFALYYNTLYEPELCDSVEYEVQKSRARVRIHPTGTVYIQAPTMVKAREAADQIYPLVKEFCTLPRATAPGK